MKNLTAVTKSGAEVGCERAVQDEEIRPAGPCAFTADLSFNGAGLGPAFSLVLLRPSALLEETTSFGAGTKSSGRDCDLNGPQRDETDSAL